MARAALNWTVRDLAEATGLHRNTITNIEVGRYAGNQDSLEQIESVFRNGGIEFLADNGVRLLKPEGTKEGEADREFAPGHASVAPASWTMRLPLKSSGLASPHFFLPEPDEHGLVPVHNDQRVGPLPHRRLTRLCNLHIFAHAVRIRP